MFGHTDSKIPPWLHIYKHKLYLLNKFFGLTKKRKKKNIINSTQTTRYITWLSSSLYFALVTKLVVFENNCCDKHLWYVNTFTETSIRHNFLFGKRDSVMNYDVFEFFTPFFFKKKEKLYLKYIFLEQGLSAGLLRQATYTTARLGSFRWGFVIMRPVTFLTFWEWASLCLGDSLDD